MSMGIDDNETTPTAPPSGGIPDDTGAAPVVETMGQAPVPDAMAGLQQAGVNQTAYAAGHGSPEATLGPEPMGEHAGAMEGLQQAGVNQVAQSAGLSGAAPGGAQGEPNPTKRIASMVMGEGAAPIQALRETAKAVDPHNTQPPGNQNMMAIDAEVQKGNMKGATALLQSNRLAWGSQQAFALSAINGAQGKPPDLNAAIDAANKAEQHVVDGSIVKFSHAGDGNVTATVTMATGGEAQTIKLTTDQFKQFLNIGDNHWDKLMNRTVPATLQEIASGQRYVGPQAQAGKTASAEGNTGDEDEDNARATRSGRGFKPDFSPNQVNNPYSAPHAQSLDAFPDNSMKFAGNTKQDNAIDASNRRKGIFAGDQPASPGTHDGKGHYLGPPANPDPNGYGEELEKRSRQIFPDVGHEAERQQWMSAQEEKEQERQVKKDIEVQKGDNLAKMWGLRGQTATTVQDKKNAGAQGVAETRAKAYVDGRGLQLQGKQAELAQKQEQQQQKHSEFLMSEARKGMTASQATLGRHFNAMHNNPLHEWTPEDLAEEKAWQAEVTKGVAGPRPGAPPIPTGQAAPPPTSVQAPDKDAQAVAWARANPNDPRAAKIMQKNGVQ